ncbi:acyl-CoA dehydrogenase family protein [Nocardioides sp. YIM 152315]|uniref:acyl-CoA dehydrogenase family protein n=1 Tax=Nocardioides sp. YIM 152315 TaxID=3031760 RepID=UPI0023DBAA28|nr:acyl-CoA dehydrogenase family protein [Nocardioides sp. YIM 152315]MDF1604738.1 acyl-CoA dehydrogenase family protein [Nocardioides sp. YIM 152315]
MTAVGERTEGLDFALDPDLVELRTLAERILADRADVDRVRQVEESAGGFDADLWSRLADAGLLAAALADEVGGAGLGMLGLVTLLEQQGRRVAPIPLADVLAGAAVPIARWGSAAQREHWLPGLLSGSLVVTAAFDETAGTLTAQPVADGWVVSGRLAAVAAAPVADAVVAPARTPDGSTVVLVVPLDADGVTRQVVAATDRRSCGAVSFARAGAAALGADVADGVDVAAWVRRRLRVASAAVQLGVCEEALATTAAYVSERVQFGRPISTNQAVAVRAADAYLDTEALRLTTQHAAWLLDRGEEEAAEAASLVAKHWAGRGGLRVVHATQHLHGGIGADVDYPIHRYFLWGRQGAFALGSPGAVAAELGELLPDAPRIGAPEQP